MNIIPREELAATAERRERAAHALIASFGAEVIPEKVVLQFEAEMREVERIRVLDARVKSGYFDALLLKDAVRAILRKATRPVNMDEISRAVGQDIGPYSRLLGQLEADGEIESVVGGVQWKPERFTVVAGDSIG